MATKRRKIGRNQPCPCGSGKKYKRCHGASTQIPASTQMRADDLKKRLSAIEAIQKQRELQQGLGRPIISTVFAGYRIVAVGTAIYYSKEWKTFHDFLFSYIRSVFGDQWCNSELRKPPENRHPLMNWCEELCNYLRQTFGKPGEVRSAAMTGLAAAYLGLSYNLYLLGHNVEVQSRLVERLKHPDHFHGAYYETYVAGAFILAGFRLELENEGDVTTSHCEFTATSAKTGNRYSVEAKSRFGEKASKSVSNQLYNALRKKANYTRVVFININVPSQISDIESIDWLDETLGNLRAKESTMTIDGNPAPPAYVFVTNHPYLRTLDGPVFGDQVVAEGFNTADFKMDTQFRSLRGALLARDKHHDMYDLMESLRDHRVIPATFDGEIPEFAFNPSIPRLKVGQKYLVPDKNGIDVPGELISATIVEQERLAYGVYRLDEGSTIIATCPTSDEELLAYRKHADTFFGIYQPTPKESKDPLDLYDWCFGCYRKTPKERLLEFMKDHPDVDELRGKSQEELASTYCERFVYSAMRKNVVDRARDETNPPPNHPPE